MLLKRQREVASHSDRSAPSANHSLNVRISPKVDVWSAGIIFYQMLYGCRPYGEGKSQENVWSEGLIYNASQVEFPNDPKAPKVSDEAKDLIRACLTKDHKLRCKVIA